MTKNNSLLLFVLAMLLAFPQPSLASGKDAIVAASSTPTATEATSVPAKTNSATTTAPTPVPTTPAAALNALDKAIGQQLQALVASGETGDIEPQETFGTRTFDFIIATADILRTKGITFLSTFAALPQLGAWFSQQSTDSILSARWINTFQLLFLVLGGALSLSIIFEVLLTAPRRRLIGRHSTTSLSRLWVGLGWLGLALIPVFVFVGMALALMNSSEPPRLARFIVMNVIYAVALQRIIRLVAKFIFAPKVARLRLVALSDSAARFIYSWIARLSMVIVYGYFFMDVARLVRAPAAALTAFNNLLGLIIVLMASIIILQKQKLIAQLIRGDLAEKPVLTAWQSLRLWVSRTWASLAIAYLVIGYAVTITSPGNGFDLMLRGTIVTLVTLSLTRMILHGLDILSPDGDSHFYRPFLRGTIKLVVRIGAMIAIIASWGIDVASFFATPWGQRIVGSTLTIAATLAIASLIYEGINCAIDRQLNRIDANGNPLPPSARTRTLLPLARNAILILLSTIVILMTLSELGVNIAPLLAGAGVIGVAIGFGSQSLVKDFITGLFILLEDSIAIGDWVTIGDCAGTVESMTIRTLRLRALNGDLHILPFGEVTRVTNSTKTFSFALIDVSVSYNSNLEKVMTVLQELGSELENIPRYAVSILSPIEVFGVEQLADSAVIIRSRIKTVPGKQAEIKRAFLLLVKGRFAAEGIEIPYPTVRHISLGSSDKIPTTDEA